MTLLDIRRKLKIRYYFKKSKVKEFTFLCAKLLKLQENLRTFGDEFHKNCLAWPVSFLRETLEPAVGFWLKILN